MRTTLLSTQNVRLRLGAILFFALLTAVTARITVPLPWTPVPITLQVMAVLLAGLVLGPVDGFWSQAAYLGAIAAGLPLDARGLGTAALVGPTAGYLLGFAPAAFTAGWLGGRGGLLRRFGGALAGVAVVYTLGTLWLGTALGDYARAVQLGVVPFILIDLGKAFLAAATAEGGRRLFGR